MESSDYWIYKNKRGNIAIYRPRLGNSPTTKSGRLNTDRIYEFGTGQEAAKFLFDECARTNYWPSLDYQVPADQRGNNLGRKIKELVAFFRDDPIPKEIRTGLRKIIDDKRREAQMNVRPKIITKQKGSSGERLIRIRKREKISICS